MMIETKRLILRDYNMADEDAYWKLKSDSETMYYLQGIRLFDREGAKKDFQRILRAYLAEKLNIATYATVTTDAVYRQTFQKEAIWREKGCVGVDMEASALMTVSKYYDIPAVTLLICSDKHPLHEGG